MLAIQSNYLETGLNLDVNLDSLQTPLFSRLIVFFFGRVFPFSFLFAGLLFVVIGGNAVRQGWQSESWPLTTGMIRATEIRRVTHQNDKGFTDDDYRLVIQYGYEVDGTAYDGQQRRFGDQSYDHRSEAEEARSKYVEGDTLDVFYDPDDPATSVLTQGVGQGAWVVLGIGAVTATLGFVLSWLMPRWIKSFTQRLMEANRSSPV